MDNIVNVFWAVVWAVVLVGVITGIFWKPALYVIALLAAFMVGVFMVDYIRIKRKAREENKE